MIRYLHFREYDHNYKRLSSGELGPRTLRARGGCTVAYIVNEDNTSVHYAKSMCHHTDNYNRKLGRVRAAGRLLSEKQSYMHKGSEADFLNMLRVEQEAFGCELQNPRYIRQL